MASVALEKSLSYQFPIVLQSHEHRPLPPSISSQYTPLGLISKEPPHFYTERGETTKG